MSGWDAHCESVKVAAGNTYIESTIFNAQGDTFTAPHALYLKDLTKAEKVSLIATHDKKNHATFKLNYGGQEHKFLCVQQTEDFTVFTFSGKLGDTEKPVMVLSRTKTGQYFLIRDLWRHQHTSWSTAAVLGLFNKREANVDHVCKVAANLSANGI